MFQWAQGFESERVVLDSFLAISACVNLDCCRTYMLHCSPLYLLREIINEGPHIILSTIDSYSYWGGNTIHIRASQGNPIVILLDFAHQAQYIYNRGSNYDQELPVGYRNFETEIAKVFRIESIIRWNTFPFQVCGRFSSLSKSTPITWATGSDVPLATHGPVDVSIS